MWGYWFPSCSPSRTALTKTLRHVHQAEGLPASDLGAANHPSWSICPHHREVSGEGGACIFTDNNQEPDWVCLPWIAER